MLSGDPDQAKPICDESGHKEGAYKGEGGNKPRDAQGRAKEKPAGALDLSELVGLGVAFRKEFDDAVLLSQRHRLTDPTKADVADEDREAFIADAERFRVGSEVALMPFWCIVFTPAAPRNSRRA